MADYPCTVSKLRVYLDIGGKSWSVDHAICRAVEHIERKVREAARTAKGPITIAIDITAEEVEQDE